MTVTNYSEISTMCCVNFSTTLTYISEIHVDEINNFSQVTSISSCICNNIRHLHESLGTSYLNLRKL